MTTNNLRKLIVALRNSKQATDKVSASISEYTDGQCDFLGDQHLAGFLYGLIDSEYGEYSTDIMMGYIDKGKYEVLDRDKVPEKDGKKFVRGDEKEQYIKEVITDDERFIEYFTSFNEVKQTLTDCLSQGVYNCIIQYFEGGPDVFVKDTMGDTAYEVKQVTTLDKGTTVRVHPTQELEGKTNFVIVQGIGEETGSNGFLVFDNK